MEGWGGRRSMSGGRRTSRRRSKHAYWKEVVRRMYEYMQCVSRCTTHLHGDDFHILTWRSRQSAHSLPQAPFARRVDDARFHRRRRARGTLLRDFDLDHVLDPAHVRSFSLAMTEHPTLSWEAMQDGSVFYRRHQLYSIPGKLPGDLQDFIIAGCRYGGPIGP